MYELDLDNKNVCIASQFKFYSLFFFAFFGPLPRIHNTFYLLFIANYNNQPEQNKK